MQDWLRNLSKIIADEQRRIRRFIEQRQTAIALPDMASDAMTQKLLSGLSRLWGCEIDVEVTPKDARISRQLAPQLDFILSESIANAVNHGRASHIDVKIAASPKHLLLDIRDNGGGLKGISGRYDGSQLAALNIGPISLRNRVTELNGSLFLLSSRHGVTLQITLPL
jgi:signal transduction histidine kinase